MSRLRLRFGGYDAQGLEIDQNWISSGSKFGWFIWFVLAILQAFRSSPADMFKEVETCGGVHQP